MSSYLTIQKQLNKIQIVRPPKHRLATFGATHIDYTIITNVANHPDRSRVRRGEINTSKPIILTPNALRDQFHGFGDQANKYTKWLLSQYGDALRGLEYQFKNSLVDSRIELITVNEMVSKISKDFDQSNPTRHALITAPNQLWELALMKFIIEETLTSFNSNFQELNERGFFEGEVRGKNRRIREIKLLLDRAQSDKSLIPILAQKLKTYELFERFQDEFFKLVAK